MGRLDGKVALVTGSGRNIGRTTVLKLAAEGAHVVVNSRTNRAEAEAVAREAQARGVKALSIVADVGKKDQVDAMAARVLSEFGRVDILINNAAIRPHKPFTELTPQDWEAVRSVVLDGAVYLTRAVIDSMVKNRYGRIVFFTGEGAFMGGSGRAHVSAAKMGLVGLARGLASEFAAHNIRVNVVSPGSIDTARANPEWYQGRTPTAAGIPLDVRGRWTRSPPPACSWSPTTGVSSPARPFTRTAARRTTEQGPDPGEDGSMIQVRRLGKQIGAEIHGVDVKTLDDAGFAAIYRAWLDYNVVVVPGQELQIEDFLRYSRRFGLVLPHPSKSTRHPDYPEITQLGGNKVGADGQLDVAIYRRGAEGWHTDGAYDQEPFKATQLYALAVPSRGGDTLFASMYTGYEALPQRLKEP